jgi:glycosyltransferase involved in cell wall biosynthesis
MIEAMACGTPVIAYPAGSVPEVVEDGITGFIVPNADAAVKAIKKVESFDRAACRRRFEERFTASHMSSQYLRLYETLLRSQGEPVPDSSGVPIG